MSAVISASPSARAIRLMASKREGEPGANGLSTRGKSKSKLEYRDLDRCEEREHVADRENGEIPVMMPKGDSEKTTESIY